MPEWLGSVARWVISATPLIVALIGAARAPSARRARFREDVELLEKLPQGRARELMLTKIESHLELEGSPNAPRRDTSSLVMALISSALLIWALGWLFAELSWWRTPLGIVCAALLIVFAYGVGESAAEVPRDARGKRIPRAVTAPPPPA